MVVTNAEIGIDKMDWVLASTAVPMSKVTDDSLAGMVTLAGTVSGLPAGTDRSTTNGRSPAGVRVRVPVTGSPARPTSVVWVRLRLNVGTSESITVTSATAATSPGDDAVNA